jgi:hypothetical protein
MKAFIVFFLSCASVLAADSDAVRVTTTTKTNASGAVTAIDTFTRAGHINLVRHTKTKAGSVQIRIHRFYHGGALVGDFMATPNSSGFTTEAGSPQSVSFEFDARREPTAAVIASKEGVIVDAFTCTNGVFSPVESSRISTANATGKAVRQEMEKYTNP